MIFHCVTSNLRRLLAIISRNISNNGEKYPGALPTGAVTCDSHFITQKTRISRDISPSFPIILHSRSRRHLCAMNHFYAILNNDLFLKGNKI